MHWLLALLVFTAGPVCGAWFEIRRGGHGIGGGMTGGVVSYAGFWVFCWLWFYFNHSPGTGDPLGQVVGLVLLLVLGAAIGIVVGIIAWIFVIVERASR
jgi:hypothetical protein